MNVSIIIPTYNRHDLLDRLLDSIKRQTFREYEIIVVDDNSSDKKKYYEVITKYSKIFKEIYFYSNNKNMGAPYCRNFGIKNSKYELLALVDDDDIWLPQKLEKQVKAFQQSNDIGLVYTWTKIINEQGKYIGDYSSTYEGNVLKQILKDNFIPSPSVMVRKKAIIDAGLFDKRLPSCQDWDMWVRILNCGYSARVIKSYETLYYKHNRNSIGKSKKAKLGYKMFYKKHFGLYLKYFLNTEDFIEILKAIKRMV